MRSEYRLETVTRVICDLTRDLKLKTCSGLEFVVIEAPEKQRRLSTQYFKEYLGLHVWDELRTRSFIEISVKYLKTTSLQFLEH